MRRSSALLVAVLAAPWPGRRAGAADAARWPLPEAWIAQAGPADSAVFAAAVRAIPGAADVPIVVDPAPLRGDSSVLGLNAQSFADHVAPGVLETRRRILRAFGIPERDAWEYAGCAGVFAPPDVSRHACPSTAQRVVIVGLPQLRPPGDVAPAPRGVGDSTRAQVTRADVRVIVLTTVPGGSTMTVWDFALVANARQEWHVAATTPLVVVE